MNRSPLAVFVALAIACLIGSAASAQTQTPPPASPAVVRGLVTMQEGALVVAGVTITLTDESSGRTLGPVVSDAQGRFRFGSVPPGRYRLDARCGGFADVARGGLQLTAGQDLDVPVHLTPAMTETVKAVQRPNETPLSATSKQTIEGRMIDIAPVAGDDFQSLLPMLPGVVRGLDGRISMMGGRPAQTGLQVSQAYVSDPTTGQLGFTLPADAISTVDVLPNPYSAEYGRFSSGVTRIETRRGDDTWRFNAVNFIPIPCLKLCDGRTIGVRAFDPRAWVGGPLIANRLFLSQSVQGRYHRDFITGLPSGEAETSMWAIDAFTRLDFVMSPRHRLTGTFALFPRDTNRVGLNAFNPPETTAEVHQRGYQSAVTETWTIAPGSDLESTINYKRYDVTIGGGTGGLVIAPAVNAGAFFNRQTRNTTTVQWIQAFSRVWQGAGHHISKVGLDVLHASFDGKSESDPVSLMRVDGTLVERWVFGAPTVQQEAATDVGAFVQDLWRVNDRLIVELGARFDRDGVLGRAHSSPRAGVVIGILPDGRGVLRGGAGRFIDRTPLLTGAFDQIESPTVTRFLDDGVTPASTTTLAHAIGSPMDTPSGRIWNVEYDQRFGHRVLVKLNHLERTGTSEFIVQPSTTLGRLILTSGGRSFYRETELTFRYLRDEDHQATVSFVHSRSESDTNAFDDVFGNLRAPFLRENAYALTSVDAPNRVVALAVWAVGKWRFSPLLEVRDGFPYSVVDGNFDFVGPRNDRRFPFFWTLDLNVSRLITIAKHHVRVGLKVNHVFNNALPRDVQANLASPLFGTFYNSITRRVSVTFELRP